MYGLPQAGILANKLLAQRLATAGYYQCQYTPGLWRHVWRPITFCLVVDDFGIKTVGLKHPKHLQSELEKHYERSMDWKGELFCGVHLDWNYKNRTVRLSMPDYARNALIKFCHPTPKKPQNSPYQAAPIDYGSKQQKPQSDDTPPCPRAKSNSYNKWSAHSCFSAEQSTQPSPLRSVPLPPDKTTQPRPHYTQQNNYSIMSQLTQTHPYNTSPAT